MENERGRVVGLGGVFFKSGDSKALSAWYEKTLGVGPVFRWRERETPEVERATAWCVFPKESGYFEGPAMVNYIVDDLDAVLERLKKAGVRVEEKREEYDYGRFGWAYDPDGNKIELWEPKP